MKGPEAPFSCPVPLETGDRVQLAHGGGGKKTESLIERCFLPVLGNEILNELGDGALLRRPGETLAFTTDSFVVNPIFFPGGDLGCLSVYGTVNDLAVCGAEPLFLSAGFILEEGFPMEELNRVVASMGQACERVGVRLVTGDTKVVDHGKADGLFINTTGLGRVREGVALSAQGVRPGDAILVSGPIGDHGIAVMAAREGIELETRLVSDCGPVHEAVAALLDVVPETRFLRDPTRGGLATAAVDIAKAAGVGVSLGEADLPIRREVRAACELLGLDPLYVACEGRFVAVLPEEKAQAGLDAVRRVDQGAEARIVGHATEESPGRVVLRTRVGSRRIVEKPSGEQLPRIC